MMLQHLGQYDVANCIANAWLATIEDGIHTGDIRGEKTMQVVGTREFSDAIIARLGRLPSTLQALCTLKTPKLALPPVTLRNQPAQKAMVGVDVFIDWRELQGNGTPDALAQRLKLINHPTLKLVIITSRGVKVWPQGIPETALTDHWRCRFYGQRSRCHSPFRHYFAARRHS